MKTYHHTLACLACCALTIIAMLNASRNWAAISVYTVGTLHFWCLAKETEAARGK